MHHIQKNILKTLTTAKQARFSEMRPPRTDSNVYTYHLAALQREDFVTKDDKLYTLTAKGLAYVERISIDSFEPRLQSKIITIMVVQSVNGKILLWPKSKQPFIGTWSLLSGKMHLEDNSVLDAARRECLEKFSSEPVSIAHIGDSYVRAYVNDQLVSSVFAHICRIQLNDDAILHPSVKWCTAEDIQNLDTAPATNEIIAQALSAEDFFFTEYNSVTHS